MMSRVLSILLVIATGVLCSGTQQGVTSTQAGQTLQIQSNARKYNKHSTTEKPCATGLTTGTRKDKPESADTQDYVAIGGTAGPGYPYPPYPYPVQVVQSGRPVQQYYPYEPQYPVETAPPGGPYYAPYYPAASALPPYYPVASAPTPSPYYPAPGPTYTALPYHPAAYPVPSQQQLYEQSTIVDAYRSPPAYLQQADGLQPSPSQQFYRQPGATPPYYYPPYNAPHYRAHAYNRPTAAPTPPAFLQQRDAAATAANNVEPAAAQQLYEQQQSSTGTGGGQFDGANQFHHY